MKNSLMASNSNKNRWPLSEAPQEEEEEEKSIFYLSNLTITVVLLTITLYDYNTVLLINVHCERKATKPHD